MFCVLLVLNDVQEVDSFRPAVERVLDRKFPPGNVVGVLVVDDVTEGRPADCLHPPAVPARAALDGHTGVE